MLPKGSHVVRVLENECRMLPGCLHILHQPGDAGSLLPNSKAKTARFATRRKSYRVFVRVSGCSEGQDQAQRQLWNVGLVLPKKEEVIHSGDSPFYTC